MEKKSTVYANLLRGRQWEKGPEGLAQVILQFLHNSTKELFKLKAKTKILRENWYTFQLVCHWMVYLCNCWVLTLQNNLPLYDFKTVFGYFGPGAYFGQCSVSEVTK